MKDSRCVLALATIAAVAGCTESRSERTEAVSQKIESGGTLFQGAPAPQFADASDGVSYDLGVRFKAVAQGRVSALRYWKAPSETLPSGIDFHLGKLYGPSGELLGVAKFRDETAFGWQEALMAAPVALALGQTYTVVVDTYTHYVATHDALTSPITRGKLQTIADGANGVFGPIWEAPTQSYRNSNYYRDVVFTKLISINVGGERRGWFNGDRYAGDRESGRLATPVSNDVMVDVAGVANAAPPEVYATARQCAILDEFGCYFTIAGLDLDRTNTITAGASYKVRLHFAEIFGAAPGQRQFDVKIGGQLVLDDFDIAGAAGPGRAVVREFDITAGNIFGIGAITIQIIRGPSAFPVLSGIEIIPVP